MRDLNKQQLDLFDAIWSDTRAYVNHACNDFAANAGCLTQDDLIQDCAIKLIDLIRESRYKPNELPMVFKTSVWHMLRDEYRKTRRKRQLIDSLSMEWPTLTEDMLDNLVFQSYVNYILNHLQTDREKAMFRCLIHPDEEMAEIVKADNAVNVEKKHLARRFGVSPATVSRFVQRLNLLASDLLDSPRLKITRN